MKSLVPAFFILILSGMNLFGSDGTGTFPNQGRDIFGPDVPSATLVERGAEFGMVLLPEETTWGFSSSFPELLRRKVEIMRRHLPETGEVLRRWFDSEY